MSKMLYDHYKETCEIQRNNIITRNRLFVYVVILLGIQFLLAYNPDSVGGAFISFIYNKYDVDLSSSWGILQSILWAVVLFVSVRYFQVSINIEKTYFYIHSLEELIRNKNGLNIGREGENYLACYPIFSSTVDFIYKWVFPTFYILGLGIKLVLEFRLRWGFLFDALICLIAIFLCILYIIFNVKITKEYAQKHQ